MIFSSDLYQLSLSSIASNHVLVVFTMVAIFRVIRMRLDNNEPHTLSPSISSLK